MNLICIIVAKIATINFSLQESSSINPHIFEYQAWVLNPFGVLMKEKVLSLIHQKD